MNVELFGAHDERMCEALAIRFAVFVGEQRAPPDIEIDEHDAKSDETAVHALVCDDTGATIAAGRFYRRDAAIAQVGRIAVLRSSRGHGAGALLLNALIAEARRCGYKLIRLYAQTHAQAFYAKAGFTVIGEEFEDAGIPHVEMERNAWQ